MRSLFIALSLLMFSLSAQAGSKNDHDPIKFDPAVFEEQHSRLVREVSHGERYREITPENRETVLKSLSAMAVLLKDVTAIEAMREENKVALFNHQELINTLLTQAAEESRLICRRETQIGSHRQTNVCKTVAERRNEIEQSREFYRSVKHTDTLDPDKRLRSRRDF